VNGAVKLNFYDAQRQMAPMRLGCGQKTEDTFKTLHWSNQWLKCKNRGGWTLYSGLGPRQWLCVFP